MLLNETSSNPSEADFFLTCGNAPSLETINYRDLRNHPFGFCLITGNTGAHIQFNGMDDILSTHLKADFL